ncbi:hypothetical protein [Actinomadura sp. DC4]|uniref:hypothetical protein n=1 Tax=Actinomadura sp. DC4 TaxID=3055069 RepID=UPI0025B1E93B|nr:hypothetical protein [Actinomadura sp. DC4]MDN3359214.1 hypothetical protein [Actinomadura sp. DC4]
MAFVPFPQEGDDVHKKSYALAVLAVAAAGGVLLTGSPANAGTLVQGYRHHHYSSHRNYNRNANWNRNHNRVVVRVNVRNHNVNTAWAGRDRDRDDDFGLFRHRCGFGCGNRFNRFDDFDDDDDRGFRRGGGDDDDGGDRIIVGNDIRTAGDRD